MDVPVIWPSSWAKQSNPNNALLPTPLRHPFSPCNAAAQHRHASKPATLQRPTNPHRTAPTLPDAPNHAALTAPPFSGSAIALPFCVSVMQSCTALMQHSISTYFQSQQCLPTPPSVVQSRAAPLSWTAPSRITFLICQRQPLLILHHGTRTNFHRDSHVIPSPS